MMTNLVGHIGEFIDSQESWAQYSERIEQFFIANDIPVAKKASVLLATIGPAAFHTIGNLVSPRKPSEVPFDTLISVMSDFYNPKPLVTVQRYKFYSRFRRSDESIAAFVAELRSLAKDCDFGASLEDNLRDRLICGVSEPLLQKKLLAEQNLTFKRAFEIAQSQESATKSVATLQQGSSTINQVKDTTRNAPPCHRCGRRDHLQSNCKFRSATCHHCGKLGHIKPVCRSLKQLSLSATSSSNRTPSSNRTRSSVYRSPRSGSSSIPPRSLNRTPTSDLKQLQEDVPQSVEYDLFTLPSSGRDPLYVQVEIDQIPLQMELDTGASFSVISKNTYDQMFSSNLLQPSDIRLKTYTGENLPVFGQFNPTVGYQKQEIPQLLVVAGENGPSLLGRNWLSSMRLDWCSILNLSDNKLSPLLEKYSKVFSEGLGTLKGFQAKLFIKDNAKPIFCKARPVPYNIRSLVEKQLERLVDQNVIEPIAFSDWAAPIVPVMKPDKSIRICGDFKLTINKVCKIDRYPIPKIEDLFSNLAGGIAFTKLDLSQAYQQLELDDISKSYAVINTHRGLFRYNRLPFGISSAPGIFQRTIECLLRGIPNVIVYLDDILVTGKSESDHLQNLQAVLQRLEAAGLHLKRDKCKFLVPSSI